MRRSRVLILAAVTTVGMALAPTAGAAPHAAPPADYYQPAEDKQGAELAAALHGIIRDQEVLSYDETEQALKQTDAAPDNPDTVLLLYSDRSARADGDWNREHVWAKSHGDFGTAQGPGTDMHHLRPSDPTVNSTRSNLDFDTGGEPVEDAPGNSYDEDSFEPRDAVKGDVARMIMYMDVRYNGGDGFPDLSMNDQVDNGKAPHIGRQSVLLNWHQHDPPSQVEKTRNDVIFEQYQHNRNPFIDHPEWASSIWDGSTASP